MIHMLTADDNTGAFRLCVTCMNMSWTEPLYVLRLPARSILCNNRGAAPLRDSVRGTKLLSGPSSPAIHHSTTHSLLPHPLRLIKT